MADLIGGGYVEVFTKGMLKVQAELNGLKDRLAKTNINAEKLNKEINASKWDGFVANATTALGKVETAIKSIGKVATKSFLVATAALTGFVALADPVGFDRLKGTMGALAVQIGSIFIPVLDSVAKYMQKLLDYFRSLSDAQKDNILHWAKIALVVVGVVAIIPKVIMGIRMATTAMALFGVSTGVATGGITIALGLIAALIPLMISLFGAAEGGEGVGGMFAGIGESLSSLGAAVSSVFTSLANAIKPVLEKMVAFISNAFQRILPIINMIVGKIGEYFALLFPVIQTVIDAISSYLDTAMGVFDSLIGPIGDMVSAMVTNFTTMLFPIIRALVGAFQRIIPALVSIWQTIMGNLVPVFKLIFDVITKVATALTPVYEAIGEVVSLFIENATTGIEMLLSIWQFAVSFMTPIIETLVGIIGWIADALIDTWKPVIQTVSRIIITLVRAIRSAINMIIEFVNRFVDWYNSQSWLPGRLNRLGGNAQQAAPPPAGTKLEQTLAGRHTPTMEKKPEFTGLAELWAKAQQAVGGTENNPERERQRLLEESNRLNRDQLEALRAIQQRVGPFGGGGFGA